MYFKISLLFVSFSLSLTLQAQKTTPKDTKVITISNKGVKDCFVQDGYIWMLDEAGVVWRIDEKDLSTQKVFTGQYKIVAIASDSGQHITVADAAGSVIRAGEKDTTHLYNIRDEISHLVRLQNKALYIITDRNIYFGEEDRVYFENAFSNPIVEYRNHDHWRPSCIFTDNDLNIWMGFDEGEWGGDIIVFSTIAGRFINMAEQRGINCFFRPVRSIFQADSTIYASTSLQHMMMLRGLILRLGASCHTVFESDDTDSTHHLYKGERLYIGPALYRDKDSSFYFYCQFGVFKSRNKYATQKISDWDLVCDTQLKWQYGQPAAVGSAMNVTKMFFAGDRLFLISPANGVMIWDGKEKILMR